MAKPSLFIGSSAESLSLANTIHENLEHVVEATVWTDGTFLPSHSTFISLLDHTKKSDFAVFVFSPDDIVFIREEKLKVTRDNVVFEFGLFFGALGIKRTFFIIPSDIKDFHIPSDLLGITPLTYDTKSIQLNMRAALRPSCNKIQRSVESIMPSINITEVTKSVALVISLIPTSNSIRNRAASFLDRKCMTMPIKEINMDGITNPEEDLAEFKSRLKNFRKECDEASVREVHVFIAGPVQTGSILGAYLSNWINVKLYHNLSNGGADEYQYWSDLSKI
jgi:hypothetical protein